MIRSSICKLSLLLIGLILVGLLAAPVAAEPGTGADTEQFNVLPYGHLFRPLIADPKQPRFYLSYLDYNSEVDRFAMGSAGYGEKFGLYRWNDSPGKWQVNMLGGLFAQFNLDAPSMDLINADYTVGFPVTYRRGNFSTRLRLYHQSSHLGDEYLLRAEPERINLSFESLEVLASYRLRDWRFYGGGEYFLHRIPKSLERRGLHWGIEYLGYETVGDVAWLLGGVDVKSWEEHDWRGDVSVKLGFELRHPRFQQRHVRIVLEGYDGYSPYGQFYEDRISYLGVGIYLGL